MTEMTQEKPTDKIQHTTFRRRRQLERDLEHITQEMYKKNKELADTNKTLSLLRTIDALVLESHASVQQVCSDIAQAITQATDYPFVGIFTASQPRNELTMYGWSLGFSGTDHLLDRARPVHVSLDHEWFGSLESQKLINIDNVPPAEIADFLKWEERQVKTLQRHLPLKSLYVIKLSARRRLVGMIVIGFTNPVEALSETDSLLLDRLSDSVGVALDNKLLFEENQHVLRQLKESNAKLRALDEAKDDFVSMASHQLRTPLTSVKGYISMVLEGDAGKISPMQKKLLEQSFFSSQRMVYLIADLLNVSRLRTGKFIIEPSPVNLADMVEQEIGQLKDTAAGKNLTLTYKKPKNFPLLMLDETKTRQVIMNFADNAIYYTPSGGHITVELAETPSSIELRVKDDGIGVPKAEKHHLFTKFYRAGNARQARPDGTGLGLFMAKKVVVAEGGAIIFESQEGKGSTFGFTFSKSKLQPPAQDVKADIKEADTPVKA